MTWKGALVAGIVAFAILYTFVFQNPIFQADVGSLFQTGQPQIQVTPYLPASTSFHWGVSAFAYACTGTGPGLLAVSNPGDKAVTVVSVSIDYNGSTYAATDPSCSLAPGQSEIFVVSLGAPAGAQGSPFTGYVQTSDGSKVPFSGTWQ